MKVIAHANLSERNSLALACRAKRLVSIENDADVLACFDQGVFAESYLLLGGGTNLVLPPDLDQTVLTHTGTTASVTRKADDIGLVVDAGKCWDELVAETVAKGWRGLENLSLIPGTVGAAPVQNIGAYGVELCQVLNWVEAFDCAKGKVVRLSREACEFAYRDSIFKRQPGRYFILRVALILCQSRPFSLAYAGLEVLSATPKLTSQQVRDRVIALRQSKLPDPAVLPNAGSFFKNPVVGETLYCELKSRYPDLVAYPQSKNMFKLAAGWLIEKVGKKGYREESVGMHEHQALVLVNHGGANQGDVLKLAQQVQNDVLQAFGVALEIEPVVIGA